MPRKHFDLFSGYGGFSLASERNGFETIGFSEINKYASGVLKYHWSNIKNYGDIKKIDWADVPDFDLLTGGSPCQDLSIAGKRAGLKGERSGLFYEYMRAVKEKKPKYFIWENVKGAMSSNNGWDFATIINEMAETGYSLWWQVLNAKDFVVPQNRERIFIVGFRDGSPGEVFFERRGNTETDRIQSKTNKKQEGFQSDTTKQEWNKSCIESGGRKERRPCLQQITKNQSQGYRVYNPQGISATLAGQAGGVGAKTGLYAIPVLTPDRLEKRQNGRRMKENGDPSFTLTSQDRHGIFDGKRIRRLTPVECERLMSLPDGWTSKGIINGKEVEMSDAQRYKMCGNGVVVKVVEELIKLIIK